jgi:hypothetical protein
VIKVVPLEPWHVEVLLAAPDTPTEQTNNMYADYVCSGEGYTFLVNDEVYACAGVIPLWFGLGEGWSLLSRRCTKLPLALCKAFKNKIKELCEPYRRVQITVEEDFEKAVNFAKFLGFTCEGRMLYYSPDGKTHLRFARYN